jgi:hypothetical protein
MRSIALDPPPDGPTIVRPTIVLCATDAGERAAARAKLPLAATVITTPTWAAAAGVAAAADCILLVGREADALIQHVREFRARLGIGLPPILVCAPLSEQAQDSVLGVGAVAVLPADVGAEALWGEVQHAVSTALLSRTAARFAAEERLGAVLGPALVLLCAADPPPASVIALADAVHAHRRTLWYQWRRRTRAGSPRLEDVVTTVLLLRAAMCRARGVSWTAAALGLRVHRHTLARGAARLLALPALPPSAGEAADLAAAAARRAFVDNVVRPVLRGQVP